MMIYITLISLLYDLREIWETSYSIYKLSTQKQMDTSGIEPDTSRMLSERDKPTTPCALASLSHYLPEERC